MKVLVTGATTNLGIHVCKLLQESSHEVVALSRNPYQPLIELGINLLQGDVRDKQFLEKNLIDVEAIIHLAAKSSDWGSYEDFYQTNVVGTKTLLEVSKNLNVKFFIYASSASIALENFDQEDLDESVELPIENFSFFSKTKAISEKYVLSAHKDKLKTLSLRLPILWDVDGNGTISNLINKAKNGGLTKIGVDDILLDILYYKNAAIAFVQSLEAMMDNPSIAGYSYYISQERPVLFWEFFNQILSFYHIDLVEDHYTFKNAYRLACVQEFVFKFLGILRPAPNLTKEYVIKFGKNHYFSNNEARKAFNFYPKITIEEAMKEAYSEKFKFQNRP